MFEKIQKIVTSIKDGMHLCMAESSYLARLPPLCPVTSNPASSFNEGVRAYTTAANLRWALFLNGW